MLVVLGAVTGVDSDFRARYKLEQDDVRWRLCPRCHFFGPPCNCIYIPDPLLPAYEVLYRRGLIRGYVQHESVEINLSGLLKLIQELTRSARPERSEDARGSNL